jgi:hypothetical protein
MTKEAEAISEDLIVRLHIEMSEGRGDGEIAEGIREESEDPWYALSDENRDLLDNLSGDLYNLDKSELRYIVDEYTEESSREGLKTALENSQWVEALRFSRRLRKLQLEDIRNMGRCYEGLGFLKAAAEFLKFASDPANEGYVSEGTWPSSIAASHQPATS